MIGTMMEKKLEPELFEGERLDEIGFGGLTLIQKPEEFCYIGDSNVDMETAGNAGMRAVGVSWGYRDETVLRETGADVIVHSAQDILDLYGL